MAFDPRHWNLILPLALAASACTTRIPGVGEESGETGTSDATTVGDSGDDGGEDGAPECIDDDDCLAGYYCLNNTCYYEDWCDSQNGPERCSPYECYTDGECEFGLECRPGNYCDIAEETPECDEPVVATPIPIGEISPGVLHFAQVDEDPEPDLLVITSASVIRVDGVQDAVSIPRDPAGGTPIAVRSADLDGDGVDELLVLQEDGTARLVHVGISETQIDIAMFDGRLGNFMADETPELVAQTSLEPYTLLVFDIAEGLPAFLDETNEMERASLLPLGPPNHLGFQSIRLLSYPQWGSPLLLELAGEQEPSFAKTQREIDSQSADAYRSGEGPLSGEDEAVPVVVGTSDDFTRVIAPTLKFPPTLPPRASLHGAFDLDDPVVVQHGESASVVVLGPHARRLAFDGADFTCQEAIPGTEGAQQIAAGDFDGDGGSELVTLTGSQLTVWDFE